MTCEIVLDVEQGSPEWIAMRRGVIGSTKAHNLLTEAKRKTLFKMLFAERVTHSLEEQVQTAAMRNGTENEASGLARWELETGLEPTLVGYVWLKGWRNRIGCSPDALVGETGIVEVKVPTPRVHCGYVIDQDAPDDYKSQMQFILAITGRIEAHFVSFCPTVSYPFDYFHKVYQRDEKIIDTMLVNAQAISDKLADYFERHT